jgi:hypothetical protein
MRATSVAPLRRHLVAGIATLLLLFLIAVRFSRVSRNLIAAYNDSSMALRDFVRNVPRGSVVYGPVGLYFLRSSSKGLTTAILMN